MENNQGRRQSRNNKQIIFIICIYMILTISNRFTSSQSDPTSTAMKKIQGDNNITVSAFFSQIQKQTYGGVWTQELAQKKPQPIMGAEKGNFRFEAHRVSSREKPYYTLNFNANNGQYIDDGSVFLYITKLEEEEWVVVRQTDRLIARPINQSALISATYHQSKIFQMIKSGNMNLTSLEIEYAAVQKSVTKKIILKTETATLNFSLKREHSNIFGTISLALILFLIACSEFAAILEMLKKFMEGQENPEHYSCISLVMALMWDASLCLISFIESFQAQENIVLFIIPAFIFALLFTNLQLRTILFVFQSNSGGVPTRQLACKFNLICYGSLVMIYPILLFTNLSSVLFVAFSLIYLPQVYVNALVGKRPDPNSVFYNEFLSYRFLTFFYMRCFPLNIFGLKPNYILGLGIVVLVGLQLGLLWLQKIYGPKKVFPRFMLPAIYDYNCALNEVGLEEEVAEPCSICLCSLHKEPQGIESPDPAPFKVMQTPCGHIYHGECLTSWMRFKMECPQCRAKLPQFQ